MSSSAAVPPAARHVRRDWIELCRPVSQPEQFDHSMLAGLPEPALRWLTHAIAPGVPLARSVELRMHGEIRLGSWRPFTATQVLAPPDGFIWAARTRVLGLTVSGYDRFSSGTGQMRWRVLGSVPMMSAEGADISASAAGRLAAEGVLLPTQFRAATWTAASADQALATWHIGPHQEDVHLRIGQQGELREVSILRWGNPDRSPYGRYPFGVAVDAEDTFAGITIPSVLRAGWWWGTDRQEAGEFFRARITDAVYR